MPLVAIAGVVLGALVVLLIVQFVQRPALLAVAALFLGGAVVSAAVQYLTGRGR